MADVEWIKISTGMFEVSRKIKRIELMKDGDRILIIWFKLLILAGRVNDGGAIYITEDRPYDVESLAGELRRPIPLVKHALDVFQDYQMIEIEDNIIYLINWKKYQSVDKLEMIRAQNRARKRRQRSKEKVSRDMSRDTDVTCHEDVTDCHAIEEEEEREKESHSFIHSLACENDDQEKLKQLKFLRGKLGEGVVMLSDEQFEYLCDNLSLDELNKYIGIIRDCEKNGQHYTKKTHFQAILDMVKKDRKVKRGDI